MKNNLFVLWFVLSITIVNAQIGRKELNNKDLNVSNKFEEVKRNSPSGLIRCATHEFHLEKQKAGKALSDEQFENWLAPKIEKIKSLREARLLPAVIRIPVVVHVVHNGDGVGVGENIADGQVLSQITVLNQDYRRIAGTPGFGAGVDTTIEFCMATVDPNGNATNGIVRHNIAPYTNNVVNGAGGADWETRADIELAKQNTIWDPTKYLNMWTFRFGGNTLQNGGVSDLLGYAQFPTGSGLQGMPEENCIAGEASTDGLTMGYGYFGSRTIFPGGNYSGNTYDKGRTATHEIGHGFGLRHIWGDSNCGDDFCADTPVAHDANYGCPAVVNCTNTGNEMVENYMDYTDDSCMSIFTQNQKDRMLAVLQNSPRRDDLLVSPVCNAPQASIQFKRIDCSTRLMNTNITEGNGNGCAGYTEYTIPLSISKAPTQNAVVTFSVDASSIANASDIQFVTPTVTFPIGSVADQNLVLRVLNDAIIESNESLIITFAVNANGGDAFAHADGNKLKVNILNDDIASSPNINEVVLNEDFEDTTGWTTLDADNDTNNWLQLNGANGLGTAPNTIVGKCMASEKNLTYLGGTGSAANPNNYLISPQITIPNGANSVTLQYIVGSYGAVAGNYTVYFTTNIASAANINAGTVLQPTSTIANGTSALNSHNLAAIAGQTGYIVFRHSNSNTSAGLLMIDSVNITAVKQTQIQTAVNTTTQFNSNVSVNGSFVARDNSTQKLMADITSNTNFNYGCTTVAVTRDQTTAGAAAVNYGSNTANNLKVMAKRFTVTPANANISGTGVVKFYFTDAEIAAWESATGNNRSTLRIIKDGVATVLTTTLSTFGANTALQANVNDGIGGVYYFGTTATLANENFEFEGFKLFPNPNKGSFNLTLNSDSNKVSVKVYDLRGREIFNKDYSNSGIFNQTVQLNNIQSGIYLVNISDGIRKTTKRIVVE